LTAIAVSLLAYVPLVQSEACSQAPQPPDEAQLIREFGCPNPTQCTREELVFRLKHIAGPDARDCGDVALGVERDAVLACAKQALDEPGPFRVVLDVQGVDSAIAVGLARGSSGAIKMLTWDSDVTGGGAFRAEPTIWSKECVSVEIGAAEWMPFKCVEPGG
jgi:hypothetical protein